MSQLRCKLCFCYSGANDIILLSSSGRHSQLMLDLCCGFGAECDLLFNFKKSLWGFVGVLIGIKYPLLRLGFNNLSRVDSFVYFGVNFKLGLKLCVDYTLRYRKFLAVVCGVLMQKQGCNIRGHFC